MLQLHMLRFTIYLMLYIAHMQVPKHTRSHQRFVSADSGCMNSPQTAYSTCIASCRDAVLYHPFAALQHLSCCTHAMQLQVSSCHSSLVTSLKPRCCRNILSTSTKGFMGGRVSIRSRTKPAAIGPLGTSKLMSKFTLLSCSMNLMIGTLAFATTCQRATE